MVSICSPKAILGFFNPSLASNGKCVGILAFVSEVVQGIIVITGEYLQHLSLLTTIQYLFDDCIPDLGVSAVLDDYGGDEHFRRRGEGQDHIWNLCD